MNLLFRIKSFMVPKEVKEQCPAHRDGAAALSDVTLRLPPEMTSRRGKKAGLHLLLH